MFTVLRAHQMNYILPKTDAGRNIGCASGKWTMMWMVSLTLQMKIHFQTSALTNELWCSVKRTLVASNGIQVNVMQKSVVYWKWPNVVDIYTVMAN